MFKNPNYVYGPPGNLVPVKLNFGEFILDKIWSYRDNVCFINAATHEQLTYLDIAQSAMNFAVSLHQLGFRKGHTVAICSENRQEFFGAVIGAACAGAVVTTFNVGYSKGEIKHVASISKPKYLVCSPAAYKVNEKAFKSLVFLKKIIIFGKQRVDNAILYNDLVIPNNFSGSELRENVNHEDFQPVDVQGQSDTLFVLYSSGTTGLAKGVMLTHLNVISACTLPPSLDPSSISLTITPWYHVMGLVGNITALATGRTAVYMPRFDTDLFLRSIERYKVEQLTVVPPVLVAVIKVADQYDLSRVKFIVSGAAPLHKDTLKAVAAKFPNATVMQGYGMTEVTLGITRDTYDKAHLVKPGGVGYVVACNILKVADTESRRPLGPNQRGEICVKGPLVMKGYLGITTDDFDDEGFFKTGDIGYYNEDKYFFVVDRLKELIKYKGYQVPPAEIEATLLQHEGVKDCGVVGIEHRTAGELPLAFVVPQPGTNVTEGEIQAFVAERYRHLTSYIWKLSTMLERDRIPNDVPLAHFKVIVFGPFSLQEARTPLEYKLLVYNSQLSNPKHLRGGVRFVDQIPKNPSGKILRKELKKMAKRERSKL